MIFFKILCNNISNKYIDKDYGTFKKYVAEVTKNHISNIQERYNELINSNEINEILDQGIKKSKQMAEEKYELMKIRMGITRKPLDNNQYILHRYKVLK